jgi:hypothetical protein
VVDWAAEEEEADAEADGTIEVADAGTAEIVA